ncbi:ribosomal-processing cysteine protease Prp [Paenibacillus septentrionalis]|uniref:Ribosomal processing cysteine protease Prp n=1 Tax=Paenibacillus septentrionalis TaxID=429342 RepID=A0ABW1V2D7_9BACL
MITVTIERDEESNRIVSFAVEGHANYAKHGKDIVCAGVSAVSVGTVNAIEALAGVELPVKMKNGWLSSPIPRIADKNAEDKVQLLLESMIVSLDTIAQSYGDHVVVHDQNSNHH